MSTTAKERYEVMARLGKLGIHYEDAHALRRISMTLQRWFELECGDGNEYGSWAIERDENTDIPYMVHHHYRHGMGRDYTSRTRIADRENGARKRLARIMAKYPNLVPFIQTDPRGASLYILTKEQAGPEELDCIYSRGVAVY